MSSRIYCHACDDSIWLAKYGRQIMIPFINDNNKKTLTCSSKKINTFLLTLLNCHLTYLPRCNNDHEFDDKGDISWSPQAIIVTSQ